MFHDDLIFSRQNNPLKVQQITACSGRDAIFAAQEKVRGFS
jgi:hypothetical protein